MTNITITRYGLAVEGAPVFIQAGALHYFRLPHPDLWPAVLVRLRMAGLNAVVIPFPWAYHSPAEGFCDFTGPRDIERLLDDTARAGLWLIPSIGPWQGLDLDGGGVPAWVQRSYSTGIERPGDANRDGAAGLLRHVSEWWEQLFPKFRHRENLLAIAVNPGPNVAHTAVLSYTRSLVDWVRAAAPGIACMLPESLCSALIADNPAYSSGVLAWSEPDLQRLPGVAEGDCAAPGVATLDPTTPGARISPRRRSMRESVGAEHLRGLIAAAVAGRSPSHVGYVLSPAHVGVNWGWWGSAGSATCQGRGAPVSAGALPPDAYYPARRMALTLETLGKILTLPANPAAALAAAAGRIAEISGDADMALTSDPPAALLGQRCSAAGLATFLQGQPGSEALVHLGLGVGDAARLVEDIPLGPGTVRVLPVDWQLAACRLLTTTLEPVLHTTVAGRELVILLNESGGEVLLPADLRIRHRRGPVYVERVAQGLAVHFDAARVASLVLDGPDRGMLQLLVLDPHMAARVWPLDDVWRTTPSFPATWTPADDEAPARGVVIGPDFVVPEDDGAFRVLAAGKGFGYRWGPWRGSDPHTWLSPFTWQGAQPVSLPSLAWASRPGAPETLPEYEDRHWRAVVAGMPLTMESLDVDYGFIWYRGHFDGAASSVTLVCRHACDLFLNGHHIAALSPSPDFGTVLPKTLPLPVRHLREHNVLALLVENQGRPAVWDPATASHGLIACELDNTSFTQWRVRGGLTGERRRQGFSGFADWSTIEPDGSADIIWHRSCFELLFAEDEEARVYLALDQTPTQCYIYLNGYLIGRLWYPRGEERRVWLPDGVLRRRGSNELLIAQWTRGAEPGLGSARLEADTPATWQRFDAV